MQVSSDRFADVLSGTAWGAYPPRTGEKTEIGRNENTTVQQSNQMEPLNWNWNWSEFLTLQFLTSIERRMGKKQLADLEDS